MMRSNHSGLTFIEHFEELRARLMRCILYVIIGAAVGLFFARNVLSFMTEPLARASVVSRDNSLRIRVAPDGVLSLPPDITPGDMERLSRFRITFEFESRPETKIEFGPDYRSNFYYFRPLDPFLLWLKAALIIGIVIACIPISFEVWTFIKPGLQSAERRAVRPLVLAAAFLFPVGVLFAWHMLRFALGFFSRYTFPGLEPRLGIMEYLGFALTLMLACGTVFELPVAVTILAWMGFVKPDFLRKYRRHAIVLLCLIAAIITPPDVFTMIAVAIPLILLYEISIIVSAVILRKKRAAGG